MLVQNHYRPQKVSSSGKVKKPLQAIGNVRVGIVLFLLTLFFVVLVARAVYFPIAGDDWKKRADIYTQKQEIIPANRGEILDRNGYILATDITVKDIILDPYKLPDFEKLMAKAKNDTQRQAVLTRQQDYKLKIDQLAILLGENKNQLQKDFDSNTYKNASTKGDKYLRRRVSQEVANDIAALKLPALRMPSIKFRHLNDESAFGQIVGKTKRDFNQDKSQEITTGLYGIEYSFNHKLKGEDGQRILVPDRNGGYINESSYIPARRGENVTISIDKNLQVHALNIVKKAIVDNNADGASVIVLNAKTGEILAVVSVNARKPKDVRIGAIQDEFEPGSTFKPFIVAKALDNKVVNSYDVINTLPYNIGRKTIKDVHDYPRLDIAGILTKSSNVGSSKLAAKISYQELYDFYQSIGVGQKPHSGFNGEANGKLRDVKGWKELDRATMSYGYSLQMSLLQLARGYTVFTNDGKLLPVTFSKLNAAPKGQEVISAETAKTVRRMMKTVTEKGGSGTRGAVSGYSVAAKTGTTKKSIDGTYNHNIYIASTVGFAPVENPKVIVAVSVDNPRNGYYGGLVAAPVFSALLEKSLTTLGVIPDQPIIAKN